MVSLGGQAPHVRRAHSRALDTCGEPTGIGLAIRVLTEDIAAITAITAPFFIPDALEYARNLKFGSQAEWKEWSKSGGRYASTAVQFHPHGGQSGFVPLPARTMHPHGVGVRVVSQTKPRKKVPTRKKLPPSTMSRPSNIPSAPDRYYKNGGWQGYGTRRDPCSITPMGVNPIPSGSLHVRCTPMGRTCGEPDGTTNCTHPGYITALCPLFVRSVSGLCPLFVVSRPLAWQQQHARELQELPPL